ncbi:Sex peptide receptor, partial [Frankliniella fusca]
MRDVLSTYRRFHGYIALAVCLFGTVANLLNVVVLTRKELSGAPINRILTWLAVADMLVMIEYVPFACYMYLVLPERKDFPRLGAIFILFHSHFAQVLHTISILLTLALAVWRYISIRFPQHTHSLCSQRRCTMAILFSYLLAVVVCIPSYLTISIREVTLLENNQLVTLYHLGLSDLAKENGEFLYILNFWVYSVLIKLLPCTILTVISVWLIKALYRANRRKAALRGYSAVSVLSVQNGSCGGQQLQQLQQLRRPTRAERRTDRTTKMLLAILLLFLITEFPQGILGLLSGILGHGFFSSCYHLFGEVMDILALLNGAINFILYCAMSRQFRTTFGQLFKPRGLMAKLHAVHNTSQTE